MTTKRREFYYVNEISYSDYKAIKNLKDQLDFSFNSIKISNVEVFKIKEYKIYSSGMIQNKSSRF